MEYQILKHEERHRIICTLTDLFCDTAVENFDNQPDHEKCAEWDRTYDYFSRFSDYELYNQYYKIGGKLYQA